MIIKKYQGKTEEEAMEEAKKELGKSVVLMNAKSVKQKGLFSFLRPHIVEVTVAKEEESETVVKNVGVTTKPEEKTTKTESISKSIHQEERKEDEKILEEKLDSLHMLLEQQIQKNEEESKPSDSKKEEKEKEVEKEESETDLFLKLIRSTLIENEVDEKYVTGIIDEIERTLKPDMPMEYVLSHIYQRMILRFGKPETIQPAKKGPKVVFFVGTTGVGKTTTIAKIASKFIVEEKKKVALLTADTYRIAAAEQLRTYANILEIPFRVIYTAEEIGDAIRDFEQFDYILVDTAGHSHHNEEQRDNMGEFIRYVEDKAEEEIYLVLSATTKYRDLLSIADNYKKIADYKIIFTKLDETVTYGNLLNLKLYTGATLSYVTNGQNVPDDIGCFHAQNTVKKLLGGK